MLARASRPGLGATVPRPGASVRKIGSQPLDDGWLAAEHETVAALDSPNASARSGVHVMDALRPQRTGSTHVVFEVRVTAVDHDVPGAEPLTERHHGLFGRSARRDHDPDGTRCVELCHQLVQRGRRSRAIRDELRHRLRAAVIHDSVMPAADQAPHHVCAHATQPNHADLHPVFSLFSRPIYPSA